MKVVQKFVYRTLSRTKQRDKLFEIYNKDKFLCIIYDSNTNTYLSKDDTWTESEEDMLVLSFKEAYYKVQELSFTIGIKLILIHE